MLLVKATMVLERFSNTWLVNIGSLILSTYVQWHHKGSTHIFVENDKQLQLCGMTITARGIIQQYQASAVSEINTSTQDFLIPK